MHYKEYKKLDFPAFEEEILKFWKENKIFEKSISNREGAESFVFYEGPPSANGMPGIHHVMSRTVKDIFCRYQTLKGKQVKRKGGWDTHGLPIELQVEKSLGITKEDIGKKISVAEYNQACRKDVMKFTDVWEKLTERMGYWVDMSDPYITYENNYIESLWHLLKALYEKQLLYKGHTIQPFSPAAGTGLSSHELNQPGTYRNIKDTSVVTQFKVIDFSKFSTEDTVFFIAWTTTPWTLPANCALAVGEKINYSVVKTFNQYTFKSITVILAKELVHKYFLEKNSGLKLNEYKEGDKQIPFEVISECLGKDLVGLKYEQLMPYVQPEGKAFEVIVGDFVTTEDGTGIVHTASVFGADDFRVCKENNISSILVKDENGNPSPLVDKRGRFVKEVIDFADEYVKEQFYTNEEKEIELKKQGGEKYLTVDERISIKLKKENKAFKVERYEHSYPHCWRTDKPIIYYPLESWFIKTTACKDKLVELNKTINWKPEHTGTGRFGNWLENLVDWNLSRSRYWGTPLPIWRTEDGKEEKCIGSKKELADEIDKSIEAGFMSNESKYRNENLEIELHKPFVDEIILVSANGEKMFREADLIDVWFDSGAMPYAQWHWPFENNEDFKKNFPADFIAEGVDQTRGWFFTLHAISVLLFDSIAYKNVIANGLVLDKNGNKMSKRLGNAIDPFEAISKYGADANRWYMLSNSDPWDNLKFDMEGVAESQRKFFGTLYHTYSFFATYANIDKFQPELSKTKSQSDTELDKWIISKLNSLIQFVNERMEDYDATPAVRAIEEFVGDHLSNWYVRLSRRRFWKDEMNNDKQAAYETLYTCLITVSQLMSPFAPFFSDWIYKNLNGKTESVHLTNLTQSNKSLINNELEEQMEFAQKITSLVLSIRKKENIKVRQPLQKIIIPVLDERIKEEIKHVKTLIINEVNVKELEFVDAIEKTVKPNFKTLGKRVGGKMKAVAEAINAFNQNQIQNIEQNGSLTIDIQGEMIEITSEDLEVLTKEITGFKVAVDGKITVALDIEINEDLKLEGIAREVISKLQTLRKNSGLEVTDRINVYLSENNYIGPAILQFQDYIRSEILANILETKSTLESDLELDIDNNTIKVQIVKV